jgi:phosphatidylglycerophosphate synthase
MDGSYARKYNMTSKFGEYYDHIKDVFANLITFYLFYKNEHINNKFKKYLITIFILTTIGNQLYLSCQYKNINKKNDSLKIKIPFDCNNINDLYSLKYIGTGTKYFLITIMILFHNGALKISKTSKPL